MATTDGAVQHKADRHMNTSPHPTQSKRDKKRQQLLDKLAAVNEKISSKDRDRIYREQLQRIQVDTNLVMSLDPYADRPLEGIEEERFRILSDLAIDPDNSTRPGARTLLEMAGPTFQHWAQTVADLVEARDFEVTKQKYAYENKEQELRNTYAWKTEVAKREHEALASTLRDRLINIVTTKKARLGKEKEALDISDSSALYLYPNQFSITNPASPGGTHSKRTTRLRREADEPLGFDGKKRKRIADDDGSPGPRSKAFDTSNATALWHGERLRYRKTTGPSYSIDKLFADRELTLNYNAAALAAHKYMMKHKNGGVNGSSPSDTETGDQDDAEDEASAPMMERQVSHATRSTRGGQAQQLLMDDKVVGLEAFANFELPGLLSRMEATVDPKLPPIFPPPYAKHSKETNAPPTMSSEDASADIMAMNLLHQYDQVHGVGSNLDIVNGGRKLLDAAAWSARSAGDKRYVTYLQGPRPNLDDTRRELKLPAAAISSQTASGAAAGGGSSSNAVGGSSTSAPANAASASSAAAAISMSRQSSTGGVAMSRTGTNSSTRGQRRRN